MSDWENYEWITSVEECPNCNREISITKRSQVSLQDSINELRESLSLHKKYCSGERFKNKIRIPIKVNIKSRNTWSYKSSWEDNHKIYL
jgi:hypothetical protein